MRKGNLSFLIALLLAPCLVSCSEATTDVVVDLRTDLVPGREFLRVRTIVETEDGMGRFIDHDLVAGADYLGGARVADLGDTAEGALSLRVELLGEDDVVVAERPVLADVRSGVALAVTVLVTRDCVGVVCPGAGDPSALACLGGRCVDPRCSAETPDQCGTPDCSSAADCGTVSACANTSCVAGACFEAPNDATCAMDEFCSVDSGCVSSGCPPPTGLHEVDCAPGACPLPPICTGLVALLHFDNDPAFSETAQLAHDFSANGNDASCSAPCPAWDMSGGRFSGAFSFTSPDALRILSSPSVSITGAVTMSAWFRPRTLETNWRVVITKLQVTPLIANYGLPHNGTEFFVNFNTQATGWLNHGSGMGFAPDVWYHLVGIIDDDNDRIRLYVNGDLAVDDAEPNPLETDTGDVWIGWSPTNDGVDGWIDEVAIWDRALMPAEIAGLYPP